MSLYSNVFLFYIIFSMQAKENNQFGLDFGYCQSFISDNPSVNEMLVEAPRSSETISEEKNANAIIPKGKGRPKGQKNSKDREKKIKTTINQQNHKRGHWSLEQNKKYHWFLEIYNKHFICKEMRRLDKIFKTMAVFIGTRQAEQCRSHHQKMQKKYHSFPSILLYLRRYHYGTQDSLMVHQDMIKNEVKDSFTPINEKELFGLQLIKEPATISSFQEEAKGESYEGVEVQKQFQFQQNLLDLLGEDYQHRFEFDNIML